jgi:hypothetical protein
MIQETRKLKKQRRNSCLVAIDIDKSPNCPSNARVGRVRRRNLITPGTVVGVPRRLEGTLWLCAPGTDSTRRHSTAYLAAGQFEVQYSLITQGQSNNFLQSCCRLFQLTDNWANYNSQRANYRSIHFGPMWQRSSFTTGKSPFHNPHLQTRS